MTPEERLAAVEAIVDELLGLDSEEQDHAFHIADDCTECFLCGEYWPNHINDCPVAKLRQWRDEG